MSNRPKLLHSIALLLAAFCCSALAHAADLPARAKTQMVATANPMASQAALAILRDGGSAMDAAIAGQMVLAVVEPHASGLGGGGLLLIWDAATKQLSYLEGLASAPAAVPPDYARQADGSLIEIRTLERSGRVVGIPGAIRLLSMAHGRHGRLPWDRLFREAIDLAQHGFAMPRYLHSVLQARPELAAKPGFSLYFDASGAPLPVGTILRNPDLAGTLRQIARAGADALYSGPLADAIIKTAAEGPLPGTITSSDLLTYRAHQRDPVCAQIFTHRICSAAPPSSGGIALLQQLAMLDRLGIADQPAGSVSAAHLFIEASRLSTADRRSHVGDPDQVSVPITGLLDQGYIEQRATLIQADQAMRQALPGAPPARRAALPPVLPESDPVAQSATTHLSIVDKSGDIVAFTTTNNLNFGADLVAEGVVLNDALTNFATNPVVGGVQVANAAAPGKRPVTTMAPTIAFGPDGMPTLIVGAGGGARIIDSVAQTILGVLAWGMDVREAIEQPRYGAQNRAVELERNTSATGLAEGLRQLGHEPKILTMNAGVQAIAIWPHGLQGWGDSRRDGVAMGD